MSEVLLSIDTRGVATVTLNRPATGNAYNSAMLAGLTAGLAQLAADRHRGAQVGVVGGQLVGGHA